MFDSSSESLPPVAALVNSSFDAANGNLSEVRQAHQDSEQLLEDVTEAEGIPLILVVLPRAANVLSH